jgi:hypothetical protein
MEIGVGTKLQVHPSLLAANHAFTKCQAPKAKHYWLVGHPSRQIPKLQTGHDWTKVVPVLNDDVTKAAMLTPAQGLQLLGARSSEQGSVDAEFFISTAYLSYFNVNTCFNVDPY